MSIINFFKDRPDAVIPTLAHEGDAGFDLTAVAVIFNPCLGQATYDTGIIAEIPEGWVGFLIPRSSLHKTGMRMPHSLGVIDSNYRGTIKVVYTLGGKEYEVGDRVAQLVVVPYLGASQEVTEITITNRGPKGFGSTGR